MLQAISVAKALAIYVGGNRGTVAEAGPKMAAAPALDPNDMGVCRFIADTGCVYNLVGKDRVERANADTYIRNLDKGDMLQTAGGDVLCKRCIDVQCDAFPEWEFNALVLNQTPSAVSIGQRCFEMRYSFYWLPCSK